MKKGLSKRERIKREIEFKQAVKDSEGLIDDFKIFLGVYRANKLSQVSNLTQDDFEKIQFNPYHILKSEDKFRKSAKVEGITDKQAVKITKENFALAFNPYVWCTLNLAQKVAVVRVANKQINNSDIKEFVNYNSSCFVMVGENYNGAFNIGAFFRDDVDSLRILQDIFNMNNIIKNSYYFNNTQKKNYNTIMDFESFETMQYISPLEPVKDLDKCSNQAKAFFWDQLYNRNTRDAFLKALNKLYEDCNPIKDICKPLFNYIDNKTEEIVKTNVFVMEQLGFNQKERDKKYLKIKCDIFNNQNSDSDYVSYNDALKHFSGYFKEDKKDGTKTESDKEYAKNLN